MARIKNNGNFSGTVGNVVFVTMNNQQFVRSKPTKVKQTDKTKKAASLFGWVSAKEKLYRTELKNKVPFLSDQYFAARHRSVLHKTLLNNENDNGTSYLFLNPQALIGFNFNMNLEWNKVANFYPRYEINESRKMTVIIPELEWNRQIKALKKAEKASLKLYAISADLDSEIISVEILSAQISEVHRNLNAPANSWSFTLPETCKWLLIIGSIHFHGKDNDHCSTAYLWAENL